MFYDYYFYDSVLVFIDSATMIVYHFRDQQTKRFATTEFRYANGLFILKEGEHYFIVDDHLFESRPITMIDESAKLQEWKTAFTRFIPMVHRHTNR